MQTCIRCSRTRSEKYIGPILGGWRCYAKASCKDEYRKKNK